MLFTPFNFTLSLERVAVYEWEPVQPVDDPPPVPTLAACDDATSQVHQQPEEKKPPEMQLVLKGYEWASIANCALFPRPSFQDCFTGGSEAASETVDESKESERRARQHEGVRRARPAGAAPDQPSGADAFNSTQAQFDPLKSRQR